MTKTPNPPRKHHFIPEFLSKQWCDEGGCLQRYEKLPTGEIHRRVAFPSQMGFKRQLYSIPDLTLNDWQTQAIETDFFSPIDNFAAKGLSQLLSPSGNIVDPIIREAWSIFVVSLFYRSPNNLNAVRKKASGALAGIIADVKSTYSSVRGSNDPATYEKWEAQQGDDVGEKRFMSILPSVIADTNLNKHVCAMKWRVLNVSASDYNLLISDSLLLFRPLELDNGHIAIPISPNRMFLASRDTIFLERIAHEKAKILVRSANKQIVQTANSFVGATDLTQDSFIRKHFGVRPVGSSMEGFEPSRKANS